MKKFLMTMLCLAFVLGLSGCSTKDTAFNDNFSLDFNEITQQEVHEILGTPSGTLSGSHGDVFVLENKTKLTVYYENNKVQNIAFTDQIEEVDKDNSLTILQSISQEEAHKLLGTPSPLHGARGDVYLFENKTKITIYYDADGMIHNILIADKDDKPAFTTETK